MATATTNGRRRPSPPAKGRAVLGHHDKTRVETDGFGDKEVPAAAYWGINTARALENFPITGRPIASYTDFMFGFACVKQAAARANAELGVLARAKASAIDRACEELKAGALADQLVVDVMQGGAGTSTNMNMNEVIANRALELTGRPRGSYDWLDPNDHVNRSQSTNDTYPTAMKIGTLRGLERLLAELGALTAAFRKKGREFAGILKVGRTQLQDAVPMTLGQEFEGFARTVDEDRAYIEELLPELTEINLGATAIGTGVAAPPGYAEAVRVHLADITGEELITAPNLIEATTDVGIFMDVSAALKRSAIKLSKICNDLRLLSSGPQAGLHEINLPVAQAGSSIMPGKVNPVIPELMNQIAFAVAGGDVTLTMAAEAGQLQLNAFGPIIAQVLFDNIACMTTSVRTLRTRCIAGISANRKHLESQMAPFVGVVTALIPHIGYATAAKIAEEALATGRSVADLVVESTELSRREVTTLLSPKRLTTTEPAEEPTNGRGRRGPASAERRGRGGTNTARRRTAPQRTSGRAAPNRSAARRPARAAVVLEESATRPSRKSSRRGLHTKTGNKQARRQKRTLHGAPARARRAAVNRK